MISALIATVLYIQIHHALLITVSLFVCQIILLTKHWTKYNIAALCVSVVLMFICTRVTHNARLFQRSPVDYNFIGTLLLISAQAFSLFISVS